MDNQVNKNFDELFILGVMANILQVGNYVMSVKDLKNSDIFSELQRQNKEYLEKIIEQNIEIIELLKER